MATAKINVPFHVPRGENSRIFKDECLFCFQTPEHDDGIYVCLTSHFGYCGEHLRKMTEFHRRQGNDQFGNGGYLHVQRQRRRISTTKKGGEPEQKITKLAIGVEGGLQETKFEFDDKYELVIFPGATKYALTDPNLDDGVRSCCDALIAAESATRLQELESLAGQWDGSFLVATKHTDVPQLSPAPKIPPKGWRCEAGGCDKVDNLWLNLTDGKIYCGRKFYDGTGGNNHAIDHWKNTGYPLAVKLGTITAHGTADVYSYDEDEMVTDPKLEEHLSHFGINMKAMEKTEKTMLELELDLNQKYEFSRIQETGRDLKPVYGAGFTGLVNLGSSCYMNSALQTLALVPDIRRRFTGEQADQIFFRSMTDAIRPNPTDDAQVQFAKLFDGILSGRFSKEPKKPEGDIVEPESAVRPLSYRALIGKGHPEFATRRQQDVEEYLRFVFDKLEQMKDAGGASIVDSFRFEILEKAHCKGTSKDSKERRPETMLCLNVPMDKAINLDEVRAFEEKRKTEQAAGKKVDNAVFSKVPLKACLDEFAAPYIIKDVRSPFDKDVRTDIIKTTRLVTFPDYLLVQLKKFTLAEDWTPKKLEVEIVLDGDELNIEALGVPPGSPDLVATPPASPRANRVRTPSPPPEERAAMTQLTEAGFPLNACVKAFRNSNGRVDAAFEWLLTHSGDPDFDEAAPAVANQQQAAPRFDEESMGNLTGMGFTRDQARKALRLANGNVEQAIGWLLDNGGDPGEPEQPAQAAATGGGGVGGPTTFRTGAGKYRLIGFISHMGSSTHSGHYVCHLLKEVPGGQGGRRWVIYNDEKVALSEEPPKGFGYVYLFERVK